MVQFSTALAVHRYRYYSWTIRTSAEQGPPHKLNKSMIVVGDGSGMFPFIWTRDFPTRPHAVNSSILAGELDSTTKSGVMDSCVACLSSSGMANSHKWHLTTNPSKPRKSLEALNTLWPGEYLIARTKRAYSLRSRIIGHVESPSKAAKQMRGRPVF
jgi:hypothetical protein